MIYVGTYEGRSSFLVQLWWLTSVRVAYLRGLLPFLIYIYFPVLSMRRIILLFPHAIASASM